MFEELKRDIGLACCGENLMQLMRIREMGKIRFHILQSYCGEPFKESLMEWEVRPRIRIN
jgi:hypothetical protein